MEPSDPELVEAVRRGDVERFAELVRRHQRAVLRLAMSLLGHAEEAEDVAQEALVSAYRSLGEFRGRAKFSTWLYRIVVNKCQDARRQKLRRPTVADADLFMEVADPSADPRDRAVDRELSGKLSAAIRRLSPQQQTAFVLHYLHGLTLEDAAEVMGCEVGTVKSHVFRATQQLRVELAPWIAREGA